MEKGEEDKKDRFFDNFIEHSARSYLAPTYHTMEAALSAGALTVLAYWLNRRKGLSLEVICQPPIAAKVHDNYYFRLVMGTSYRGECIHAICFSPHLPLLLPFPPNLLTTHSTKAIQSGV